MSTLHSTDYITTKFADGSVCVVKTPAPDLTDIEKGQLLFAIAILVTQQNVSFDSACNSALYYADRVHWLVKAGMPEERASIVAHTRVSTFLGLRP